MEQLKSNISSIVQHTIKRKEILKEGLALILKKVNTETQTSKVLIKEEKKLQQIQRIEKVIDSKNIDLYGKIYSFTLTEDKRLVLPGK